MKNKTPKDLFQTHCWAYKVITDPYQVFTECFFFADIGAYRKTIRRVLLSAADNKVYKKEEPASVLDTFKAITSVMLAAQELCRKKKSSGLQLQPEQFTDKRLYARPSSRCAEWEYLPKSLTENEYQDPYAVFTRFFKYQDPKQWQQRIEQVLNYALSSDAEDSDLHLLKLYLYLIKLMEAAHLIDVREVLRIEGDLKPALQKEGS
ncbi:MAG: hypothetical protein J7599_16220 [Niabella sp.]|nr:hypothetical protein [Niabella sp.]